MINKQGQGKIDWTDWSWNPISGCKHGCEYCYMLRMEKRFPGIMEPKFHPDRISKLARVKKVLPGDKIFVGSSGDMCVITWYSIHYTKLYEIVTI